jgi:hypothetical protein
VSARLLTEKEAFTGARASRLAGRTDEYPLQAFYYDASSPLAQQSWSLDPMQGFAKLSDPTARGLHAYTVEADIGTEPMDVLRVGGRELHLSYVERRRSGDAARAGKVQIVVFSDSDPTKPRSTP